MEQFDKIQCLHFNQLKLQTISASISLPAGTKSKSNS